MRAFVVIEEDVGGLFASGQAKVKIQDVISVVCANPACKQTHQYRDADLTERQAP
jgi:hypothetical protein